MKEYQLTKVTVPSISPSDSKALLIEKQGKSGGGGGGTENPYILPMAQQATLGGVKAPSKSGYGETPIAIDPETGNLFLEPIYCSNQILKTPDEFEDYLKNTPEETPRIFFSHETSGKNPWGGGTSDFVLITIVQKRAPLSGTGLSKQTAGSIQQYAFSNISGNKTKKRMNQCLEEYNSFGGITSRTHGWTTWEDLYPQYKLPMATHDKLGGVKGNKPTGFDSKEAVIDDYGYIKVNIHGMELLTSDFNLKIGEDFNEETPGQMLPVWTLNEYIGTPFKNNAPNDPCYGLIFVGNYNDLSSNKRITNILFYAFDYKNNRIARKISLKNDQGELVWSPWAEVTGGGAGGTNIVNASELPANVPSQLPAETEKNVQSILNALAVKSGGSSGGSSESLIFPVKNQATTYAEVQDALNRGMIPVLQLASGKIGHMVDNSSNQFVFSVATQDPTNAQLYILEKTDWGSLRNAVVNSPRSAGDAANKEYVDNIAKEKVSISDLTPATSDMTQPVGWNAETKKLVTSPSTSSSSIHKSPIIYTVGQTGDFLNINDALKEISKKAPIYMNKGLKCEIKILSGTTIKDQISVVQKDLQFVTITAENPEISVPVDSTGWTTNGLDAHDLRENVAFFGGENAAKLPTIGCVFKLTTKGTLPAVGYFANRGSCGVILPKCGFDGFNDGVIANNESTVVIREGIARNCTRWAIHARHNGQISARSAILTGTGDTAVYADRIADIDVRYADGSNSDKLIQANNCSRINAQRMKAYDCAGSGSGLVLSSSVSTVNCDKIDIKRLNHGYAFKVMDGSVIDALGAIITEPTGSPITFEQPPGTYTKDGIIYASIDNPTDGQFAVSDGTGGLRFITLQNAAEVAL